MSTRLKKRKSTQSASSSSSNAHRPNDSKVKIVLKRLPNDVITSSSAAKNEHKNPLPRNSTFIVSGNNATVSFQGNNSMRSSSSSCGTCKQRHFLSGGNTPECNLTLQLPGPGNYHINIIYLKEGPIPEHSKNGKTSQNQQQVPVNRNAVNQATMRQTESILRRALTNPIPNKTRKYITARGRTIVPTQRNQLYI